MLDELRRALAAGDAERVPARRAFAQVEQQHVRRAGARRDGARARARRARAARLAADAQPLDALAQEYARVAAALTELRDA